MRLTRVRGVPGAGEALGYGHLVLGSRKLLRAKT